MLYRVVCIRRGTFWEPRLVVDKGAWSSDKGRVANFAQWLRARGLYWRVNVESQALDGLKIASIRQ